MIGMPQTVCRIRSLQYEYLPKSMMEDGKLVSRETETEFKERIGRVVHDGFLCLSLGLGMETGLLQKMIAMETPKTCKEIAEETNTKERYVREWLGAMVMSKVVNYDTVNQAYWLPKEHHCIMDFKALAVCIPTLSMTFSDIAECFKMDGPPGVSSDKFEKFDALMAKMYGPLIRKELVKNFIPSMPEIESKMESGIAVLDVGCGVGVSTMELAKRFPKSQIYGLDISSCLQEAQAVASDAGLTNAIFVCQDAHVLPPDWTGKFGYIFSHLVIHDLIDPPKVLKEIRRVLSPSGAVSILDPNAHSRLEDNTDDMDRTSFLFTISIMSCVPLSLCTGEGAALGSVFGKENTQKMLEDAGFKVTVSEDLNALHYFCTL